jgi:TrmH family RNA methyltransferase
VTSAQNRKVKTLLALQEKARLRKEMGLFVVEGRRELEHCIRAGFEIDTLFYCPDIIGSAAGPSGTSPLQNFGLRPHPSQADAWAPPVHEATGGHGFAGDRSRKAESIEQEVSEVGFGLHLPGTGRRGASALYSRSQDKVHFRNDTIEMILERSEQIVEVPRELYEKIAYRGGTEGMIAEVKVRERTLEGLKMKENPLVVVLEGVEKPGNIGAVLRSADAAGADAVLICDPLTDLYNPNLIRASIGAVFTVQVVCCSSEEAIKWLKGNKINIYTAQLQDSSWYYDTDMTGGTAIVVGTEATGLTDAWREAADGHIRIPMLGELDSLNASVSAAILLFEAVRQRNA